MAPACKMNWKNPADPLAVNEVINWGMQACEALQYLHSQNPPLVHGSISPASLLISPDRQNLMLDYQGTQAAVSDTTMKLQEPVSASKQTIPLDEQPGKPVPDIRSDIFDLGVTLYRLVTGQAPPDINSSRSDTPITDMRSINPAISQDFARIILRCMAINPDERYSSAVEVHDALQKLSGIPSAFDAGEAAQTTLPVHPAATQPQYQGNIAYGSPPPTQRAYDVLPPAGSKPKKNSCLLWGAIIAGVLVLLGIATAIVLVIAAPSLLPFLSERYCQYR